MRRNIHLSAVIVLLLAVSGCSSSSPVESSIRVPANGILIKGAGATFPSMLYKQWFMAYQQTHPGTLVEYDAVGSGEGVARFVGRGIAEDKQVDFGASDAAMTDAQMREVAQGVVLLPITAGSVVLVYNLPGLEKDLNLSRKAYAGIFLGEIKTWNDPQIAITNPGIALPKLTIAPVTRQDSSGTTYAFTKHLDAINETWRSRFGAETAIDWPGNAMRAVGNEGVAARVQQSVGSIGYVGYEFARRIGLKMAALENKEGRFVKPTSESGAVAFQNVDLPDNLRLFVPDPAGSAAYPIVTFSWVLLRRSYQDDAKARAILDLFRWCLKDGQQSAAELGYLPLPGNVSSKALSSLNAIDHTE